MMINQEKGNEQLLAYIKDLELQHAQLSADHTQLKAEYNAVVAGISSRKKIEEELKESNERFEYVTRATFDAVWDWDLRNDHLYWGEGYEEIFGYKADKPTGNHGNHIDSFDNIHPEDRNAVFDGIHALINGKGNNWTAEYRYRKADGAYAYVQDKAIIIRDDNGKAVRMIGAMQDRTETKMAEESALQTQEKFNSLVNTVEGIVWEADAQTFAFTYVSRHAEKLLGYPARQWIEEAGFWATHIHPEDRDAAVAFCVHSTQRKQKHQFEYRMIAADGSIVWLADFVTVVVENDIPVQLRGIMVDISERKKAEEQLARERQLLRILIDNLPDYIYVKDTESRHLINNKANVELLGFQSEEESVGKSLIDILGVEPGRRFIDDDLKVFQSGTPLLNIEAPMFDKQEKKRWLLTTKIPIKDENDKVTGLVGISRDITERKAAEEALQEKNSQLKKLSSHLQQVREDERKHLAREVHDELGQLAAVVKMDIDWLKPKVPGEAAIKRIEHASATSDLLISSIRKIALALRPGMLDELGLNASLEWQCKAFTNSNGISCVFEQMMDDTGMSVQVKTELFRICHESLTNSMRHAQPRYVNVILQEVDGDIQLCIKDDGVGFDKSQHMNGLGLIGMRERALSINGQLTIMSEPGQGTTICAIIPKM